MKIRILLFGKIKELIPVDEYELTHGQTVKDLKNELEKLFTPIQSIPYTIAVNHTLVDDETPINENDLIAIMPPFSGG